MKETTSELELTETEELYFARLMVEYRRYRTERKFLKVLISWFIGFYTSAQLGLVIKKHLPVCCQLGI